MEPEEQDDKHEKEWLSEQVNEALLMLMKDDSVGVTVMPDGNIGFYYKGEGDDLDIEVVEDHG